MNKLFKIIIAAGLAIGLSACGEKVEVPSGYVGKVMTRNGFNEGLHGPSTFRLDSCVAYCDKLILTNVSDQAHTEDMELFIPEDKLNLKLSVRTNLTIVDKDKMNKLFTSLPPTVDESGQSIIDRKQIYTTYAQQIILTETREYLSQFSIAQISSSLEKINADLRVRLTKSLKERTPFEVRYVGITNIEYPPIIKEAQENAARRREDIQQEEARLEVSKVSLQRELQETQLQRRIDVEKAEADAEVDRLRARTITPEILKIRELEIRRIEAEKWNGQLPNYVSGSNGNSPVMMMNVK